MPLDVTTYDLFALAPELALLATALLVLLVELFLHGERKRLVNPLAFIGVGASLALVIALAIDGTTRSSFGNMFVVDSYALLFKGFFLATALFVLFLSYRYFSEIRTYQGEYYFLLLSAFLGMLLMPSARDLVMLFIALELVSVPGFVMAGLRKFDLRSNEGAMKFFLIGVLSVAVLLFGLSIVYGFTGTTDLAGVGVALAEIDREPLLLGSVLFVIVGFGFKVSAVPFHFWAPDTYEGSPLPVTAFLSVASKAAGFAGLLQICFVAFEPLADVYAPILGVIAVLTMTLGNLTALQQSNVVRLFAYSSVAHAGNILVPFALVVPGEAALNSSAFSAVLVYILAYGMMNIGAFAVVTAVARQQPDRQLSGYAGLGQRAPALSVGLTLFLVSLGGILPIVVGFWAKLYILQATMLQPTGGTLLLAAAVVVNSVIGAYYYLRIARTVWMDAPVIDGPLQPGFALNFAVVALAVAVLAVGVYPQAFGGLAELSTLAAAAP
ncbi:MAG: NADH-quinone oxidoreductase subunit NuoN [Nitriliruptorales bacterium]|nr:NADH-quinone oxidoreductase subunit NuoN [Nitriliruptorales bacterium]